MVDDLMNSTRRVRLSRLIQMTPNSKMLESPPVYSPFSHSHDVHTVGSEQRPSLWCAGMGCDDPIVTQLQHLDRFCPQVLQSSVQHKGWRNIWPDEHPIFWFLPQMCRRFLRLFRRCGGVMASELREYREHFRWQGLHRNRAQVQHSSARELCLIRNRLLSCGSKSNNRRHSQQRSKYGKQSLKT